MTNFKLLVSFDGALSKVEVAAADIHTAMDIVRNDNPGRTACLVKRLEA